MKYKAIIEYKGTNYYGYASQVETTTIQGTIEACLKQLFNKDIRIYASGRTDAGVHALNQVIDFQLEDQIDVNDLKHRLNCILPNDIRFKSIEIVDDFFSARFSAKGKKYLYQICLGEADVFQKDYFLEIYKPFNYDLFKEVLSAFKGEHNFKNFTSKKEDENNFIRTIYDIEISINNKLVRVSLTGNGFMRYMVRDIIGAAIQVATSQISISKVLSRLDSDEERNILPYKADAKGLFLVDVLY